MYEWKKMTIGDVCDTISDTYRGNDSEVVLINTSDVLEGKVLNHQKVENKNLKGQFKKTFKKNDILYSEIRPANKRYQSFVLYTMFALKDQLNVFNGEGTVFGSINRNSLNDMPILIPSSDSISAFEDIVTPIDAAIRNNYNEICRLTQLRDSILPKLMSGELDVSSLDF